MNMLSTGLDRMSLMKNISKICFFCVICVSVVVVRINASEFSSKIILEGFKNARIGGEVSFRRIDCRLTGAVSSVNNSFFTIDGNFHLGAIVKKDSCIDWIIAPGSYVTYTHSSFYDGVPDVGITIRPSINCSMYRYFRKFLIGGNFSLELWQGQKASHGEENSGWHFSRLFNINPEFVIGYCF